jgi:hypothetical protein
MAGLMREMGYKPGRPLNMNQAITLAVAAREASVDFSAAGAKAKVWNQVVPFFNPAIQGTRSFARAWKRNRNPYNAFMTGMTLATASLMFWWLYKDEDWYKGLTEDERHRFWNVKIPNTNQILQIPKSQEWGTIFGTLPVELIDAAYRQDPDRAVSAMKFLIDSMRPNLLPVPVSAALEQSSNYNEFFGRPVVPEEGYMDLAAEEQWSEYTSETAKWLGQHLPKWRVPYLNVPINSPMRIDAAIREFGGGVGADIVNAPRKYSKAVKNVTGGAQGEFAPHDLPVFGRLFRRGGIAGSGASPAVNKFYDTLSEARELSVSRIRKETEPQRVHRLNLEKAGVAIKALRDGAREEPNIEKRAAMYALLNDIAQRATAGEDVYKPKKRTKRQETQQEKSAEKRAKKAIELWQRKAGEGAPREEAVP